MTRSFLLLTFFFFVNSAAAREDLTLVGKGDLSWMWFDVYEARFYLDVHDDGVSLPVSLVLNYRRNISADTLLEATYKEWSRLGLRDELSSKWLDSLRVFWPDVTNRDEISLHVDSSYTSNFYFNGEKIGAIENREFSKRFLAIWLDRKTSDQSLRTQLLAGLTSDQKASLERIISVN